MNIIVHYLDGTNDFFEEVIKHEFNSVNFYIIETTQGNVSCIPNHLIKKIKVQP
jgi:hypothetical protein